MVETETVRQWALALEEAAELPRFELTSFRIRKKIFATLDVKRNRAVLMLPLIEQSVFAAFDKAFIYPVPNSWGRHGATIFELNKVRKDLFKDALTAAYCSKAPQALAGKYKPRTVDQ